MNRFVFIILFALAVGATLVPSAQAVTLQPNEAASKDTFVYEFLPTFNLSTPPFGQFLPAGKTEAPADGHDVEALVEFDLSSVTLTAAQVTSATLELYSIDNEDDLTGTGFGANPTASNPVLVNLSAIGPGAPPLWQEATATWNSHNLLPSAGQYAATSVNGINQWFAFDVTTLVQQWLNGSLQNNGMLLVADAAVFRPDVQNFAVAAFSSASGQFAPKLTVVPEPSLVVLALSAVAALAWIGRRRAVGRNRMK